MAVVPKYPESYRTGSLAPLSFPSSFNMGGLHLRADGDDQVVSKLNSIYSSLQSKNSKQGSNLNLLKGKIGSMNYGGYEENTDLNGVLYNSSFMDISSYNRIPYYSKLTNYEDHTYTKQSVTRMLENPFHMPTAALSQMNTYKYELNKPTTVLTGAGTAKKDNQTESHVIGVSVPSVMSMFNPNYNVQVIGMSANVPLIDDIRKMEESGKDLYEDDISDCSISKLVQLSHQFKLGQINYRFADFMYCKDLGKVANNHLITLRRYSHPVGDHIGIGTNRKNRRKGSTDVGWDGGAEVGHLVTWFGTDDNKIEDILQYSYNYSWKHLDSKITQKDSQEDNEARGIIGKFANFNSNYNTWVGRGLAGNQSFLPWLYGKIRLGGENSTVTLKDKIPVTAKDEGTQMDRFRNYDNNRVYTPKQTIQDMEIPEGKLTMNHEFTLNFSYKLRSYDGINPKSAFLDLIGNILRVTYFTGSFWGGSNQIIGPKPNNSAYRKVSNFIDGAFNKIGGALEGIANGNLNIEDIWGMLSSYAQELVSAAKSAASEFWNQHKGASDNPVAQALGAIVSVAKEADVGRAIKGQIMNTLGRPAFYAFDSLLTGEDTGLWHVTIGNPRNPIAAFGNLVMTNASIQHLGPLGVDDFPTELKVTVTLKHARSRDLSAIEKMYTQGLNTIFMSQQRNPLADFRNDNGLGTKMDEYELSLKKKNANIKNTATFNAGGKTTSSNTTVTSPPTTNETGSETTTTQSPEQQAAQQQAAMTKAATEYNADLKEYYDQRTAAAEQAREKAGWNEATLYDENHNEYKVDQLISKLDNAFDKQQLASGIPEWIIQNGTQMSLFHSGTDNLEAIKIAFDENDAT